MAATSRPWSPGRRRALRSVLLFALPLASRPASAAELRPWSGGAPPALSLPLLEGGRVQLASLRGKVVLVNFWATWCAPCIKEMPSIQRLSGLLPADRFSVLAVNYGETEERIRAFLKKMPIAFPIALDRDLAAARDWGAKVLPMSFVLDRDGRIRFSVLGDLDWSAPPVVEPLRRLAEASRATGVSS